MAQALTGQLTLDISGFVGAIRQAIDQARQFGVETGKSLQNISISIDGSAIKEGFAGAQRGAKQAGENIGEAVSDGIEQSLGGAKTAFSKIFNANQLRESVLAATGALNDVVNVGNEYESTLAAVGAVTGQSGDALNKLGDRGRDLAKQFGGSASDQLKSFQGILSKLGPQVADNADALTLMATNVNTLSAASGDDAATSMNALVDTMLQLGLVTGDATKDAAASTDVMNALAASAKVGAAEIPQVAQSMLQVGVAAKGAGLDVSSTTAAIQVLAVGGKTGSEAGIALRNVLGLLQKASGPAEQSLKKMGTSSKELGELLTTKGLDAALAKVKGGMDGLGSAAERNATLMTIFGTENSAAAGILLDNVKTYKDFKAGIEKAVGEGAAGADGAVAQANARLGTSEAIMKRLKAQVEDVFISIQQRLGSGFSAAIGAVNQLAPTLTGLAGIKAIIPEGAFDGIKNGLVTAVKGFGGLQGVMGTLGGFAQSAFAAITGPIGITIAAVAALVAAFIYAYNNIEPFKKFIDDLVASFLAFVNDAGQKFQQLWKDLAPLLSEIIALIKTVAGVITDVFVAAFQAVVGVVSAVVGWIRQFVGATNETKSATQGAGESVSFLTRAFDFLRASIETVRAVVSGIITMFQSFRNTVSEVGNALASGNFAQAVAKLGNIGGNAGAAFSNGFNQKAAEISLDKAIQGVQDSLGKVSAEYSKQLDEVKKKQGVTNDDQKRVINARLLAEIDALQKIQSVEGLTVDQGIRLKKFATEQEAALRKKANDEIAALDQAANAKNTQDRAAAIKDGYESLRISATDLRKNESSLLKKQVDEEKKAIEQRLLNAANNKALTAKQAKEIEAILDAIGKKDGDKKEKKDEADLAKLKEENEKRIAKLRQSAIDDENQRKVKSLEDANAAELRLVDEQIAKHSTKLAAELRGIEIASEADIKAIQKRFAAEINAKDEAASRERDNGNDSEADKLEAEAAKLRVQRDAEVGEARKKTEERVESERKRILENGTEFERELLNKRLLINQQYELDRANLLEEIKRKKRSDELKTELDAVRSQVDLVKAKDVESATKRGELKRQELEKQQELELLSIIAKTPQAEAQRNRIKQKYTDLLRQEQLKTEFEAEEARIQLIENASERELQLSLLGLKRKRDAELATIGNNSRARLDGELQYQEQRFQIETEYLRRTNAAVSLSYNIREKLLAAFSDTGTKEAEQKQQEDLNNLKKEEQDLLKSLNKREISYVEYLEKLEALKQKRVEIEKQGAGATVDLSKAFNIEAGIAKMNESLKKFNPAAALNRLRLGLVEAVKATFTEQQKLLDGTANRLGTTYAALNNARLKAERLLTEKLRAEQEGRLEDAKRIEAEYNAARDLSTDLEKTRLEAQGKLYEQLVVTAGAQFTQLILQGEDAGTALLKVALDQLQAIVPLLVAQIFGQSFAQLGPIGGAVASGLAIAAFQGLIAVAKSALGFKDGVVDFDGTQRGRRTMTLPNMGSDPDKYLIRVADHETIVPKKLSLQHKDLFQFMFAGGNPLDYYRPQIQQEIKETVRYVVVNVQQAGAQAQTMLAPVMKPIALSAQNFVAEMPNNSLVLPPVGNAAMMKQQPQTLSTDALERALDRTTNRLERVERALNFEPHSNKPLQGEMSVRGDRVAVLIEKERKRRTY